MNTVNWGMFCRWPFLNNPNPKGIKNKDTVVRNHSDFRNEINKWMNSLNKTDELIHTIWKTSYVIWLCVVSNRVHPMNLILGSYGYCMNTNTLNHILGANLRDHTLQVRSLQLQINTHTFCQKFSQVITAMKIYHHLCTTLAFLYRVSGRLQQLKTTKLVHSRSRNWRKVNLDSESEVYIFGIVLMRSN